MSRYIDAEHAEFRLQCCGTYHGVIAFDTVKAVLNAAPSIDIVRCAECKHREKYPCDEIEFYECGHLRLHGTKVGVEDDWFCADGERKDEPQVVMPKKCKGCDSASKIIEAYSRGFKDGAEAVKAIKDEPQTMDYPQVDGITPSVIVKDEPLDKDINVRSKERSE